MTIIKSESSQKLKKAKLKFNAEQHGPLKDRDEIMRLGEVNILCRPVAPAVCSLSELVMSWSRLMSKFEEWRQKQMLEAVNKAMK